MKLFTKLFADIDGTNSTNDKVEALKRYFAIAPHEDAMWAVLILTSRIEKRVITSRSLRESFMRVTKYPEWLFEESYHHVGDTAETVSLLLQSLEIAPETTMPSREKPLTFWMAEEIPRISKIKDDDLRAQALLDHWEVLTADEIFIFNKLMTGGFRVGVSEKLVVRALAETFGISSDQVAHRISGDVVPGVAQFEALISKEETQALGSKPYPFCLAHAWNERSETAWTAGEWAIEWKFDGIRSQVIKRDGGLWIWSRGEDEISRNFPDLVELFLALPDGTVIDGEVLAFTEGKIQDFNTLQKRLGRKNLSAAFLKENTAGFIGYDCLEFNGEDIRQRPLRERRDMLKRVLTPLLSDRVRLSETLEAGSIEEIEALRSRSREQDAEGLMIKAWESPYSVGRKTGHWWKHKVDPLTLDAVLIYAQAGTGRRANLYTDYTFALWRPSEKGPELVPFAKAYSGLDQGEIDQLDKWIRTHTLEKFGPVRSVKLEQVFEIGFEGIAKSSRHKSGIAVRFPRILRWRTDKKPEDADTLAAAFELLETREAEGSGSRVVADNANSDSEVKAGAETATSEIPDAGKKPKKRAAKAKAKKTDEPPAILAEPVKPTEAAREWTP